MGRLGGDGERDVCQINLSGGEVLDDENSQTALIWGGEVVDELYDSNASNDGNSTPPPFDPPSRFASSGVQRTSQATHIAEKLMPVRLSSGSIGGGSVGSIGGSARMPLETRVTGKSPAWCDRQSPGGAKGPLPPRGRSPTGQVMRRTSAPCVTPVRCPASPQAPTPRGCNTPVPQLSADSGSCSSSAKGDVSLYVRLRPGNSDELCVTTDGPNGVRLRQPQAARIDISEASYRCDRTFGPEATQDDVYQQAVTPICDAVIRGYNGAVIAYGQTGSGKTHTMLGSSRAKGMAPLAVAELFSALEKRPNSMIEVSVLEIYNERVRDLLAPGSSITHVEVHEHCANEQNVSFRCPDATTRKASNPEEALAALNEGMKRRETARTDMNHTSSRSHLIFTLCTTQCDSDIGATLRGRLHLVDLAGSERLKRSMSSERSFRTPSLTPRTPRDQRREAGEINKSLSQMALVIQRLTGPSHSSLQYVPYRDSMLTRLLAESFGGSSKTCLIITCSSLSKDREETRCSLEFGKRAKLVKNRAEINLEVTHAPTPVMQALVQKEIRELQSQLQDMIQEREIILAARASLQCKLEATQEFVKEAANDVVTKQARHVEEARQYEDEKAVLQQRNAHTLSLATEAQAELTEQLSGLHKVRIELSGRLVEAASEIARLKQEKIATASHHEEEVDRLHGEAEIQAKQMEVQHVDMAALRAENASIRERWLADVARLEAQRTEATARAEEEKASLRKHIADLMAVLSTQQEERAVARLGSAAVVEEAAAALQQAEQEAEIVSIQRCERLAQLQQQVEAASAERSKCEELRKARLTDLEAEQLELKHKWRLAVENLSGKETRDSTETSMSAEADMLLDAQCATAGSDSFQVGQVVVKSSSIVGDDRCGQTSYPKSFSLDLLEPISPDAQIIRLSEACRSIGALPMEGGSSA